MPAPRSMGRGSDLAPPPAPQLDVWVGLLTLSLVGQLLGALFLYLDYSEYPAGAPPKVSPPPAVGQNQPAPPAPAPGAPPAPKG